MIGENQALLLKIGAMILDLWLDTSSGAKWPKCGCRSHTPRSGNILRFYDFIVFILQFWRKRGPVCENSS